MPATASIREEDLAVAMDTIAELAADIGPRRPTGPGEAAAAEALVARMRSAGVDARAEEFAGY